MDPISAALITEGSLKLVIPVLTVVAKCVGQVAFRIYNQGHTAEAEGTKDIDNLCDQNRTYSRRFSKVETQSRE